MRVRGENSETLQKEKQLLKTLASNLNYRSYQTPKNSAKYLFDGFLYDNENYISGIVEAKWYGDNKNAFCWMNVAKFNQMISISEKLLIPSLFVYRETGRCGFIEFHNGRGLTFEPFAKLCGGTPDHREPNDDDVEPLIQLAKQKTIWIAS